jgi:hypothetical protein
MTVFWDIVPCKPQKLTAISEVLIASLMTGAIRTLEPMTTFKTTQHNVPEDGQLSHLPP